jgi:ATP-dependent DNA helicase DinG
VNNIDLDAIFGQEGLLSKRIKNFTVRTQQRSMSSAVHDAIVQKSCLIAEAATGTGKTFAYLVPALLSGQKVLIATATKALQDQLVHHDLPNIIQHLGIARTVQNLKGRDNYLCLYHIQKVLDESSHHSAQVNRDILNIHQEIPRLQFGERNEITSVLEDSPAWYYATAHADHCVGNKCPVQSECFMYKARQKAMAADCVVVNHHLFFADSKLKNDGFGALLPAFEIFIFDEAHQIPEVATQFYSQSFTSASLKRLLQDIEKIQNFEPSFLAFLGRLIDDLETMTISLQKNNTPIEINQAIKQKWVLLDKMIEDYQDLSQCLHKLPVDEELMVLKAIDRLNYFLSCMKRMNEQDAQGIAWVQALKKHIRFQWSPYDVATEMKSLLQGLSASLIFTSATLKSAHAFDWFTQALGLEHATAHAWDSPYNWDKQALLYVPHGIPDVYHPNYHQRFLASILPIIQRLKGRTFILFTSHKALQEVAQLMADYPEFNLLVQGTQDKRILLEEFRKNANCVLLGTSSFWEGVDVQGEALSCVAIDKLPFANIKEPLVAGKMKYVKAKGQSPFEEHLIPQAIIALKQGVGRLIRTEQDQGILVIGDPRLIGRAYGQVILESLPPMPWTRNVQRVEAFLKNMN